MPSKVNKRIMQEVKQMKEEKELKGLFDQQDIVYWTVQDRHKHNKIVPTTGMAEAKYDIVLGQAV